MLVASGFSSAADGVGLLRALRDAGRAGGRKHLTFDKSHRMELLRARADGYMRLALDNITREYPHMPYFVAVGPDDYRSHRGFHI